MDSQDENVRKILSVKEEDEMMSDMVGYGDMPTSNWYYVTRRMKVISEWNGGRLILVDMPDGFELRRQNRHEFWNKEWVWETNLTLNLTNEETNKIKEIVEGWI